MAHVDARGGRLRAVLAGLTGSALLAAALGAAPATLAATGSGAAHRPKGAASLSALFDNVGISEDSDPTAADIDGTGHSFSAEDLAAYGWTPGAELTLDGTSLRWPNVAAGTADNVMADGQTFAMRATGDAVTFVVASTAGATSGSGTLTYTDGSTQTYRSEEHTSELQSP